MNRRHFIYTAAAALAAAASATAADPGKKRRLKKAVNLGMVKVEGTTLDRFQAVKEAGFDGIELNRPDILSIDELLKARDATGLKVAGVICSTHWGKPLTHPDATVHEQAMRGVKLALQESGELGCERLLLVPGVVNKEVSYADAYERSQAAIKELIPAAEKARCKIAVENVWNHFLLSPLEAARFVDEIGSPWVGWHFDIGNVVTFGWAEQWVRILGKRILNLHIKEFSRKKRDSEGFAKGFNVELGEGDVDWTAVMRALDEVGYEGFGIAEVPGGDRERLKFLSERMDKLFAS
jgi:L-ribulose-5-phosphate 3-epimerase